MMTLDGTPKCASANSNLSCHIHLIYREHMWTVWSLETDVNQHQLANKTKAVLHMLQLARAH